MEKLLSRKQAEHLSCAFMQKTLVAACTVLHLSCLLPDVLSLWKHHLVQKEKHPSINFHPELDKSTCLSRLASLCTGTWEAQEQLGSWPLWSFTSQDESRNLTQWLQAGLWNLRFAESFKLKGHLEVCAPDLHTKARQSKLLRALQMMPPFSLYFLQPLALHSSDPNWGCVFITLPFLD